MSRIMILKNGPVWGGMEKWALDLSLGLNEKGHHVVVGAHPKGELYSKCKKENIEVKDIVIHKRSVFNFLKIFDLVKFMKKEFIDTIIVTSSSDRKIGILSAKIAKLKNIICVQGNDLPINNRFYNRLLIGKFATSLVANSESTKNTILDGNSNWLNEDDVNVIYNGVKIDNFINNKSKNDLRKEFNISNKDTLIAKIGRLAPEKGHSLLIEAIDLLPKDLNLHLLIVGDGPLKNSLEKEVRSKGLQEKITFTGFRNDIPSILSQIDFLVHTALSEGFGYVIAESLASATPVVAMETSNISKLVINDFNGLLAEYKNTKNISKKILEMDKNKNINKLGINGQKYIEENFSFQKMVDSYDNLLRN